MIIEGIGLFIIGTFCASFLLCLNDRYIHSHKIHKSAYSYCPSCKARLHPQHLIPVLSFLYQKGKCHSCKHTIPYRYLMSELLLGGSATFIFLYFGFHLWSIALFVFIGALLIISITDTERKEFAGVLSYIQLIAAVVYVLSRENIIIEHHIISALLAGGLLAAIYAFSRGRLLGWGDVEIIFGCSLVLGLSTYTFFVLSFIFGSLYALPTLCIGKRKLHSQLPFIPFIFFSFCLVFFTDFSLINAISGILQ